MSVRFIEVALEVGGATPSPLRLAALVVDVHAEALVETRLAGEPTNEIETAYLRARLDEIQLEDLRDAFARHGLVMQ